MPTLRQICSDLATDLKAHNLDDRFSFRYLANKFTDKIAYFLRLEARSREIVKQMGTWKSLNCVELQDVGVSACADLDGCLTLKRSVKQIPEAFITNYGLLLKVLTVDGLRELKHINSFDYKAEITREYPTGKKVFWVEDKYIYLPDTDIEAVKAILLPKSPIDVDKFNCEASACQSPLDGEISYTDYLVTLAKKEVMNDLLQRAGVVEDEKGDDNTNKKTNP